MVSKCLKKKAPVLQYLNRMTPKQAKAIIKASDKELVNALCECSLDVLNGVVPLSPAQHRRLQRYKTQLRTLVSRNVSVPRKKTLLQTGGFLPALLTSIIGALGRLLGL